MSDTFVSEVLVLRRARVQDTYKDMARIHISQRGGVREGHIGAINVNGRTMLIALRGLPDAERGSIRLDSVTRSQLGLRAGGKYKFNIRAANYVERFKWGWRAADPSYRMSAQSNVISLGLGALGVILGAWSLYLSF